MLNMKESYNIKYQEHNYFGYKEWLYNSYIKGLVAESGLKNGDTILDAACGQGFFSYLFHKCGMRVYGLDISVEGINEARNTYGSLGIHFVVGDILSDPFSMKFDCVFIRSCSLYNTDDFIMRHEVTDNLLTQIKDGGTFIFTYNTNLNPTKKSEDWRYHTLNHVRQHFYRYPKAKIFFISKLDTFLIRNYAFNPISTKLNILISQLLGLGGDLVCILKK